MILVVPKSMLKTSVDRGLGVLGPCTFESPSRGDEAGEVIELFGLTYKVSAATRDFISFEQRVQSTR